MWPPAMPGWNVEDNCWQNWGEMIVKKWSQTYARLHGSSAPSVLYWTMFKYYYFAEDEADYTEKEHMANSVICID